MLKPFFTFYGGKWRSAPKYPPPEHGIIIEPFAGSAGYSVRNYEKEVVLVEKDEKISAVWKYLISSKPDDIRCLPLISAGQTTDDLDVPQAARWLIGFCLNKASAGPCKTPGSWMRGGLSPSQYWGVEFRERIASQVSSIKHWTIIEGDYTKAPDVKATWFVDPPYQLAGKLYRCSSRDIDFTHLGGWCQKRRGQTIVCENDGATWLPFKPYLKTKSTEGAHGKSISNESVWLNK